MSDRTGYCQRLERLDLRRRGDFRQRKAIGEIGEAGRQQRNADAGDVLRQAERHRQESVQRAESNAHHRGHANAQPQIAAGIDREPAGKCAGRHDALDAEVEHARPLADQFAHGGEDERRGDADGRCPESGREEDVDRLHGLPPPDAVARQHDRDHHGQECGRDHHLRRYSSARRPMRLMASAPTKIAGDEDGRRDDAERD